jgi:hypothetical protein
MSECGAQDDRIITGQPGVRNAENPGKSGELTTSLNPLGPVEFQGPKELKASRRRARSAGGHKNAPAVCDFERPINLSPQ